MKTCTTTVDGNIKAKNVKRVMPPTYFLLCIIGMGALYLLLPLAHVIIFPWNLGGVALIAAGIYMAAAASMAFGRVKTTVEPFEVSTALVTSGFFRISRNPMYLGFAIVLTGIAILMGVLSVFAVIPVFIILMEAIFIRVEEKMLEREFGETWREYRRRTRRWL